MLPIWVLAVGRSKERGCTLTHRLQSPIHTSTGTKIEAVAYGDQTMSMANAPPRELWICQCPRTFMKFDDVYAQAEYFFADVIGIVVHVSNIRERDDVRMRPYTYVVLMNERYHCIIKTVKYTHMPSLIGMAAEWQQSCAF
ncbi:uncharacterized protein [Miscanthus floridulus]|uniref:uncharacterized protein isoform X5 n=1 Tax=Miscanthus floridulus TaxID=154761 RepID=UPI003459D36F